MANHQVSLMTYLQHAPQAVPVILNDQSRANTTNSAYSYRDIHSTQHWQGFNIQALQQDFGQLLQAARIIDESFPASPPQPVASEDLVRARILEYIAPRVRRALRTGFQVLSDSNNMGNNQSVISMDSGGASSNIDRFAPDLSFFSVSEEMARRFNRVPGDIKPSYKWSSALAAVPEFTPQQEFKQALSQVNWYMKQHHARYGYLLTDRELVAIRRLDGHGNLELATPIPWTATGNANAPQMTVLLGLWYLGMLASDNANWQM